MIKSVLVIGSAGHSYERLEYILGKVLGDQINFEIKASPIAELAERFSEHEKRSLARARELLAGVDDGDNAAIYDRLRLIAAKLNP